MAVLDLQGVSIWTLCSFVFALVLGQAIPFNFHDKPFQLETPRNYFSATSSSAKRLQLGRAISRLSSSISHRQLISNRASLLNQVTTTVRLPPPTTAPPHVKFYVNYVRLWSRWGEWSSCNVRCGGGTQTRRRRCVRSRIYGLRPGHTSRRMCGGKRQNRRKCNTRCCPVRGKWGEWNSWQSLTFNMTHQLRRRECHHPPQSTSACQGRVRSLRCPGEFTQVRQITDLL